MVTLITDQLQNPGKRIKADDDDVWRWPQSNHNAAVNANRKAKAKWRTCRECRGRYNHTSRNGLCRRCFGRITATETAVNWLADDPLFLEVNSTGLGDTDQIVEVALLDAQGNALLNTLVKPTVTMTPAATAINGLTDGALTAAPNFADVGPALYALLAGRRVVVYDVQYDTRLLAQSDNVFGIVSPPGISTVDPFVKTHTKQINVRVLS